MNPECNVNVKEIGNIVNEMMASKYKHGRQAFSAITNEEIVEEGGTRQQLDSVAGENALIPRLVRVITALHQGNADGKAVEKELDLVVDVLEECAAALHHHEFLEPHEIKNRVDEAKKWIGTF